MSKAPVLRLLFSALREAGYEWQPQTPDRLLSMRKAPEPFRPLVQLFGLGLPVVRDELISDGLPEAVLGHLDKIEFARALGHGDGASASGVPLYKSTMAVSGAGDLLVVHDHWPPDLAREDGYVHFASESAWLSRQLHRDLEGFIDKRVLDLGCSSGALALEVGGVAREVVGLDISARSIEWARETAGAYGFKNLKFHVAAVGSSEADAAVGAELYDCVVMNPPMVVPAKDAAYPHRDGGKLGIELPLVFLEYARRHLREGGEVQMLATNPIVRGKPALFEKLTGFSFIEKRLLHSHFNQEVARKQGYAEQGIEQIELWFLHLKR